LARSAVDAEREWRIGPDGQHSQPNLPRKCVVNVVIPDAAQSRAFYPFVTAGRASKLRLISQIKMR
jgi:hypothetical protein